jgi:hypothetical protein
VPQRGCDRESSRQSDGSPTPIPVCGQRATRRKRNSCSAMADGVRDRARGEPKKMPTHWPTCPKSMRGGCLLLLPIPKIALPGPSSQRITDVLRGERMSRLAACAPQFAQVRRDLPVRENIDCTEGTVLADLLVIQRAHGHAKWHEIAIQDGERGSFGAIREGL